MKIGYARVSTEEQNLDLQLDALKAAGCDEVFQDEGISAVAPERPGFRKALAALSPGDTFVIWKLDRAFRSTVDAILTLAAQRDRGVEFQCLTMHIDTSTPEGRKWYRDTASWAEYERELIAQRTKAGMAAAKQRGKHVGRPRALTPEQVAHARDVHNPYVVGRRIVDLADVFGVSPRTLSRSLSAKRSDILMDLSERLAFWTLPQLLPDGCLVVPVQEQSDGEHDFDVFDGHGNKTGIVEVTTATYQETMRSHASVRKHEVLRCPSLQKGWALMAHNPDPIWTKKTDSTHLAVFENHGLNTFDHQTEHHQNSAVAQAARGLQAKGISSGEACLEPGQVAFLMYSGGESDESSVTGANQVVELVDEALQRPDNRRKLSAKKHGLVDRHFFVRVDGISYLGAFLSIKEIPPPSQPMNLKGRATHVWVAVRWKDDVFVWRGTATGWEPWTLAADASLDQPP